ncbi:ABC transporter substrate-binding protein [Saccharibacillus sp. CPCC 101409]|uniref:ABC transporter substrate-binding protein n=1 Tax=Saccharibacillus sp. CPCC 101409 TaxID=3058041 RepID=UPI0026711828|nr:ABC transporter substrate-binding protein [Saccharibacillus sp. CPCC 101409]MDO3408694.1 ABC transporter substrate-binding protein [Saccharibacillus sp. CPCC 101409]
MNESGTIRGMRETEAAKKETETIGRVQAGGNARLEAPMRVDENSAGPAQSGGLRRMLLTGASALLLSLGLAACGGQSPTAEAPAPSVSESQSAQEGPADSDAAEKAADANSADAGEEAAHTVYPLTLKDATGEEIAFDAAPTKIVSLAPSETEALFALGLDEQIVGVSDNDDYPEEAKNKPKMGGFELNTEAIVAAQPDVVFVADVTDDATVESLRGLGLNVFKFNPDTLEDVMDDIAVYGEITDRQAEAKTVTDKMRADIEQVRTAAAAIDEADKQTVYLEFSPGWTVGGGEFMNELIETSGAVNAAADTQGWSEVDSEAIIGKNPDVILYSKLSVDPQTIKDRSGWANLKAIQNDRLVALNDNLVSRPGPRITDGLIEVFNAVYPDKLK